VVIPGPTARLWFTASEAARIAQGWEADLYFSAGECAPLGGAFPRIASFRNPVVFRPPDPDAPHRERLRLRTLRALAGLSARRCDRIMFVSEDSAAWIGDAVGLAPERRTVVHHGIDPARWRAARGRDPVHPWPYILSVGSVYRYKNFVRLIEAYAAMAQRSPDLELPDLVIIGDDQDPEYLRKMHEARAATGKLAGHIQLRGEVPYADVPAWYAGAELFAFPSSLETFGHPLLEAMAAEVPVVAADIPVFREIAADAAIYADPADVEAMGCALLSGLSDRAGRETLVKRGRERVRHFGWDRTARLLLGLFADVLDERAVARTSWRASEALPEERARRVA